MVYELNGAIYLTDVAKLNSKPLEDYTKVKKYEMDEMSLHDIDKTFDWVLSEVFILSKQYR